MRSKPKIVLFEENFIAYLKNVLRFLLIITAGFGYACALKYFVFPAEIILNGTEGISSALGYYFSSKIIFIILYLIFQISLLIFAFLKIGKKFTLRTGLLVAAVASFLFFLPDFAIAKPEPENERITLALFGGIIAGASRALAFICKSSTGDDDIISAYYAHKYRKPVGIIFIYAAIIPIVFGLILNYIKVGKLGNLINILMYTSVYIFISSVVLNNLFVKYRLSIVVMITRKPKEVGKVIMLFSSKRSYTMNTGIGGHSKEEHHIFKTVVTREELSGFIKAVKSVDKKSFIYYHDIAGVAADFHIESIE